MSFADDLKRRCIQAGQQCEQVARMVALEMQGAMIEKSPVGNQDLWKANAGVQSAKTQYLEAAIAYNEANPGKRRKGTSKSTLSRKFRNKAGRGYTGGRFKSNWQVGFGSMNTDTSSTPGSDALGRARVALESFKPGMTIFLTNNLAYAKKLEYGHSSQAPAGIVRLTVQDFAQAVKRAVQAVKD